MKKILGILALLIVVCIATEIASDGRFFTAYNMSNVLRRSALFGIISVGAGFVIITGGIDLSIGSVICIVGVLFPWLLVECAWPIPIALATVFALAILIGLGHGLLVTKVRLQPFVVTLCGLLLYRGIARGITDDQTQGFGADYDGFRAYVPTPWIVLAVVAVLAWIFLNRTVWGRYLLALGRNEEAARFSGIRTDRMTILAYVVCAFLAGLGGLLFVVDNNLAQPSSFGNFYELYAIAGAVLGGCALRGGEGSIVGILIGAALMQALSNSITLVDAIPKQMEFAVIGAVILGGVTVDEIVKRLAARGK